MLSEQYIMQRVREYAKTEAGKVAIRKKYGIEYSEGIDLSPYREYGRQMKDILYRHVNALIRSVASEDILVSEPKLDAKGSVSVMLSFREGSLRRDSLYKKGYPDGLENIVLLFAHGYQAGNHAYGVWKYGSFTSGRPIRSRTDREPNGFLKDAVDEFNRLADGAAMAVLTDEYSG